MSNQEHSTPQIPRVRLEYSYLPRGFIEDTNPKFVNPLETVIKGLVYSIRYLPRTDAWFAKGVFGSTEIHPQLPILMPGVANNAYVLPLPETASHTHAGVFSTGSLDSGDVTIVQALNRAHLRPDAEPAGIDRTRWLIAAVAEQLASATTRLIDLTIEDGLSTTRPTHGLTIHGSTNPLPHPDIRMRSDYRN